MSRNADWNKKSLIESRLGRSLSNEDSLCAFHCFSTGIGWKQPSSCQHSDHIFQNGKKQPKARSIPLATLKVYNNTSNRSLPAGAAFCMKHLKSISCTQDQEENENNNPEKNPVIFSTPDDDIYVPEQPIISEESLEGATNRANSLCDDLVMSPLSFQIKQTRVKDLTESTKQKLKKKFERVKLQLEKKFAETNAPGQSEELIAQVLNYEESDRTDVIPEDLTVLVDMFKQSDSLEQIILLAVVNHDRYTKEDLIKFFGCKKHQID